MKPSVRRCLLFISLFLLYGGTVEHCMGQVIFPSSEGEKAKFTAYIEMPRGYISGICVLAYDEGVVKGCLFNEFGITALDFSYDIQKQKVKLHSVIKMMDKWYIRRVLRKDLRQLMRCLQDTPCESSAQVFEYRNERHHIIYQFTPMEEELKD